MMSVCPSSASLRQSTKGFFEPFGGGGRPQTIVLWSSGSLFFINSVDGPEKKRVIFENW